jgi:hypothetical protein
MTQFAWITDEFVNGSASMIEETPVSETVMSYTASALLLYIAMTAWRTLSYRLAGAELMQYLWSFGLAWGGTQLLSDIDNTSAAEQLQDMRAISYTLLGYGTLYISVPQSITDLVAPKLAQVSPLASHVVTLAAQFVPTVLTMFALTGTDEFSIEQLRHVPLLVITLTYALYSVMFSSYTQVTHGKGLGRAQLISTSVAAGLSYAAFEAHIAVPDASLFSALCMPVAALAFYLVAVDVNARAGAKLSYVFGMPFLPALPGADVPTSFDEVARRTKTQVSEAVQLGIGATRP